MNPDAAFTKLMKSRLFLWVLIVLGEWQNIKEK